jgi:diamine N-acetyltransferase
MELTLKKVDAKNIWALTDLQVHSGQREFVASNTVSILEAYTTITAGGHALPFGVYDGETPVGFLMIGYDCADWEAAPAIAAHNYCLWRLMIDGRYQGRGYGRRAAELALDLIRSFPCGPAESCWLSYEPENAPAQALYRSLGFVENGEMDGSEVVAVLPLT